MVFLSMIAMKFIISNKFWEIFKPTSTRQLKIVEEVIYSLMRSFKITFKNKFIKIPQHEICHCNLRIFAPHTYYGADRY